LFYQRRWPTKWIGELSGAGQTYRLDDDPREAAGVASEQAPETLRARTAGKLGSGPQQQQLDDESLRALEALGYLE
ncbi:MAG: hypothetical protein ABFS46_14090, partial [Myxococcota bacterium]